MAFEKIRASQYDIDGNLFDFPTQVVVEVDEEHTGNFVRKTANAYQRARRDDAGTPRKWLPETFDEYMSDEAWYRDVSIMLEQQAFGPAEPSMREGLLHAQEISFNTGRGHSPEAITKGIKQYILETFDGADERYFLQEATSQGVIASRTPLDQAVDQYFAQRMKVYPIMSPFCDALFQLEKFLPNAKVRKQLAYQHYTSYLRNKYGPDRLITIGFSEDTAVNLQAVKEGIATQLAHDPDFANFYQVFYLTRQPNTIEKTRLKTKVDVIKALTAQKSK